MDSPPRSGVHPIIWILIGMVSCPCLAFGVCMVGANRSAGTPPRPADAPPVGRSTELHLQVTSAGLKTNPKGKRVIAGTLMNTSGKPYAQVTISYRLFDKVGGRLGETKVTLTKVPSGKPVPFEAAVEKPNVGAFTFLGIEAQ